MMVNLAAGLSPEYHCQVALIRDGWLGAALRARGIPVTILRDAGESAISTLRDLAKVVRERRVELLHTHEFFMNSLGLVASQLAGIPQVAVVHGKSYYAERIRRRLAYRLVGGITSQMVAVSQDVRKFLITRIGIPQGKIRVVPNGVPAQKPPSAAEVQALRRSLGLKEGTRIIGAVGSLYPVKGHRFLIEAIPTVARRFRDIVFLIVGRGGLLEELQTQAQKLGVVPHVRFLGHRDDVADLLGIFDVFVLPSLSEGMPLSLLEAMAAGVPPVATRVGGVPEILEAGRTGILVPPGDSYALAEGIATLLENKVLAAALGEAAQRIATSRFSLDRMVQAYRGIYEDLLQGAGQVKRCG